MLTTGGGVTTGGFDFGADGGTLTAGGFDFGAGAGMRTADGAFRAVVPVWTGSGRDGNISRHGGARNQNRKTSTPRMVPTIFSAARATLGLSDL